MLAQVPAEFNHSERKKAEALSALYQRVHSGSVAGRFEVETHGIQAIMNVCFHMKLPRVYPIVDGGLLGRLGTPLVDAAEGLIEGGAKLIQLRSKEHFSRSMFGEASTIAKLCRSAGATLIVNDRADM